MARPDACRVARVHDSGDSFTRFIESAIAAANTRASTATVVAEMFGAIDCPLKAPLWALRPTEGASQRAFMPIWIAPLSCRKKNQQKGHRKRAGLQETKESTQ